jgi:23S rRNA (guanosine2251-2'-O)-methyltransferase
VSFELKNPHSVLAAMQRRAQDVLEIRVPPGKVSRGWDAVIEAAGPAGVPVRRSAAPKSRGRRGDGARSQAATGLVRPPSGTLLDEFLPQMQDPDTRGLWLALDRVQDPHNVGAIFRTAAFFGVRGVILTRDQSAPVSATVLDVASGGVEFVPFSIETNLVRAFDRARRAGLWVLGTSEHATTDFRTIAADRPWLLVVGNEERGMRRLTQESCDEVCRMTPVGSVHSLNVSVAAGILIAALS